MPPILRAPLPLILVVILPLAARAETRCFAYQTETASSLLSLELPDGNGPFTGAERGTVQDRQQGYFTSWDSSITGTRTGNRLKVTIETAIENDRQTETQVWRVENGTIVTDRNRFEPTDCGDAETTGFEEVPDHAADDIARGHCGDAEDVIFTCEVSGDRVLSVCASGNRTRVAYRFGPVAAPEIEFPRTAEGSARRFMIQTIGYAGGYDTRLGFISGPYTYMVFERMISRGPSDPGKDMESGVMVYEGRTLARTFACRAPGGTGLGLGELFGAVQETTFFDEDGLLN